MSVITPLMPRQKVPSLSVPLVGGGTWSLADQSPENFTMVVFYRGLHCPICGKYLKDLDTKLADFAKRGVNVVVVSSDGEDRATEAKAKWELENVDLGYGLDLDNAREWGLYISTSNGVTSSGYEEPAVFSEPGLCFWSARMARFISAPSRPCRLLVRRSIRSLARLIS